MKRILVFATMLLLALNIVAQSPNKISYQAVVRNSGNNIVTNQQIGVRISILKASTNGVPVYIETQSTTTNQNGLMSIIIGNGNSSYNFSTIDWANGPYFVKTETDPEGGTNYMITGISQILSVPYALHAQTAESITGTITETDPVFGASTAKDITSTNITNWTSAYSWGNHASAGYLKTYSETDPMFGASAANGITSTNISNWNSAYTWGNHASAGYLKTFTETDPVFVLSEAKNITSTNTTNWNSAYTWGNHASAGYLKSFTETDPVFGASEAKNITSANITNWNSAYTWGNHASAGYLKTYTETDPVFGASEAKNITSANITNWNSAYTWGNHASAGYLKSYTETDPVFGASAAKNITSANITNWNSAYTWGNHALAGYLKTYTETDPVFGASEAKNITSTNTTNWNSAYTWGNHASAGYLKSFTETDPVFGASAAKNITSTNTTNWNLAYTWGNHASAGYLKSFTETDPVVKSKIGIIKSNGSTISTAVAGTDYLLPSGSAAQLTNFPTLNQNTTGTASNVTGTIALTNGGTGATTATTARLNLGATTVGNNIFTLANPSDNSFIQINANNTVSTLSASAFRTAISAGTVTSVSGTAPIVSSGGNTPALSITAATQSAAGSMSAADKTKLDGIASGATNYAHPTTDGNLHVLATGTSNNGKVLTAGATAGSLSWTTPTTGTVTSVSGTAPIVSSGGNTPALSITAATQSAAGSMSAADKTKLDGIASGATNYAHPTTDGNLHVLATGTSNNGKVLTAGATAGSLSWTTPTTGTVTSVSGTAPIVSSGGNTPALSITAATQSAAGSMSAADKTKLDAIAVGAEVNVNADWNASSGDAQILNIPTNIDVDSSDDVTITGNQTIAGNKTLTGKLTVTTTAAIGTSSPETSAALEVSSTSQGFLPPRLTSLQKNAITSPVAGLLIWCSNCGANGEIQVYNGTTWTNMIGGTASAAMPIFNPSTTTEITDISALCSTQIVDDGGAAVTARGVCWSTSQNPTTANSKTTDGTGKGTFTSVLSGLTSNTTYYVRAYATTAAGTTYGTQLSFKTLLGLPTLSTKSATNVYRTSASCGGTITANDGSTITAYGICWSTTPYPNITNSKTVDGAGVESFSSYMSGLRASTLYYVRAYATNGVGTAYGNQQTFTTSAPIAPTITSSDVSSTEYITATCGGSSINDGGADVTAKGVCWSTSQNPNTANSKTNDGTGSGSFTSTITGLTLFTTYYIRAYVTTIVGTVYGVQKTFYTFGPGLNYQGGIVAYVFASGDAGYVAGEVHGLIIAPTNQSSGASWGCSGTSVSTSQSLGSGKNNTNAIEAACSTAGTAADICANLTLNEYDDWYLASLSEWQKIWINSSVLGLTDNYWSSSQSNSTMAYVGYTSYTGSTSAGSKTSHCKVRAIRSF